MAVGYWWDQSPNLRSLFPAILNAASQGATTAEVWQAIRDAAADTAESILNVTLGRTPTAEQIEDYASYQLEGISASMVSSARGAAGAMVRAHENLLNAPMNQQIEASAIARPPWAVTVDQPMVQEQYRIRVYREITVRGFTQITRQEWSTYDLTGPLTTPADALSQANTAWSNADYNRAASINQILDYTIEAI